MALLDILKLLPIISAIIWFSLATLQVYRDRIQTWTEAFFLGACFFTGLYALSDLFFFNAPTAEVAAGFAMLSLSSLTFAPVFFFLFTEVYVRRMRRVYLALFVVPIVLLPIIWSVMVQGVDQVGGLYFGNFEPIPFAVWLVVIVVFASAGIANLARIYRAVSEHSAQLGRRTLRLSITFIVIFFLGLLTNGLWGVLKLSFPPPFSTLLAIPGGLAFAALYPGTRERVSEAMRRFKAKRYTIQSGFLVYNDGTLIGSATRGGQAEIDRDLFSATLDVIQNFMRTSFPIFAGKSLKTIEHGDLKILIERGKYCYLSLVLTGEENDLLRRQMRDELTEFEERNRLVLGKWRGVQEDAIGTDQMLRRLLEPVAMFPEMDR